MPPLMIRRIRLPVTLGALLFAVEDRNLAHDATPLVNGRLSIAA